MNIIALYNTIQKHDARDVNVHRDDVDPRAHVGYVSSSPSIRAARSR